MTDSPDIRVRPADDDVLRRTLAVRAPGALAEAWRAAWGAWTDDPVPALGTRILQTSYTPYTRSRLTVETILFNGRGQPQLKPRYLFVQCYADAASAHRRVQAALDAKRFLNCKGPPVFEAVAWNAVVWALPNGPRLRQLRSFLQKKAFLRYARRAGLPGADSRDFSRPRLLRYVPRRRAVLHWQPGLDHAGPSYYIKLYSPSYGEVPRRNLERLAEIPTGHLGFSVPALAGRGGRRRAVVTEEMPGVPFTRSIPRVDERQFAAVGRALAGLHAGGPRVSTRWTPADEFDAVRTAMRDVSLALPALQGRITELLRLLATDLESTEQAPSVPIHANLFGDQILLDGDAVGILDWDDLAVGDPMFDLGRLVAHVIWVTRDADTAPQAVARGLDALLSDYGRGRIRSADERRLKWHVTAGLLMRAKISALRTLEGDWPRRVARAVEDASSVWHDRSPFFAS